MLIDFEDSGGFSSINSRGLRSNCMAEHKSRSLKTRRVRQGFQKRKPDQTNGLMFEIIARKWLREVVKGYWINAQNLVVPIKPITLQPKKWLHSIEIDAFSLTRFDNQYGTAVAEIKWRFHISPDKGIIDPKSTRPLRDIVADRLEKLTEHFNERLRTHLNYVEVTLISAHPVDGKDKHAYALSEAL